MQRLTTCKICGSKRLWTVKKYRIIDHNVWPWQEIYKQLKDAPYPLTIRLGLCRNCGFLFYLDTFSFREMKQIYEEEARYTRPKAHQLKPGRLWELDRFVSFVQGNLPFAHLKTALDLGAGDFVALEQLVKRNKNMVFEALDPSYPKGSHKGIKVYRSMLEDFKPAKQYDIVTAIHILEHVGDLHAFLKKAHALVRNNGYFYAEVPFQVGPGLFLNRSASVQHVNYFTPKTLRFLLARNGFHVERSQFDTDSYPHNGMPGMIRMLAKKEKSIVNTPRFITTLNYLLNPIILFKAVQKGKSSEA